MRSQRRSAKDAVVRGSWLVRSTLDHVSEPTTFRLHDRDWDLLPGVFAPTHCASTGFFTASIPYPRGGSFLEVGCGAGVTAVTAATKGCANVTATDTSDAAVANTTANVARHGLADRIQVRHGDMFDGLDPKERFDLIFWNSPFIDPGTPTAPPARADRDHRHAHLRQAVFDPGYRAHERYLTGARTRLTPTGRLLLGFSDLGDHDALRRLAADTGYRVSVLRTSQDLVPGVDYRLLELTPDHT